MGGNMLTTPDKCPLCENQDAEIATFIELPYFTSVKCQNCGFYRIDDGLLLDLSENTIYREKKEVLSKRVKRDYDKTKKIVVLDYPKADQLLRE
jgi:C4-type Zn-finger protein